MAQDIISKFIEAMKEAGYSPANPDIKADNKRHDYQIQGDPKYKRKGFYKLKITSDFGFGFFGDYRQGDCISWKSSMPTRYSKAEREAFMARLRQESELQEAEERADHERIAASVKDFLLFLEPATAHPYLTAKGVKSHGLLISGTDLIMPMGDESGVWNYQAIKPDGEKLFTNGEPGGKKQGTWFEIPGDDVICICEGYATGASVHEATGHTVVVALDAGNIVSVAPKVAKKYAGRTIIYAADNDRFTKNLKGELINPGINKAKEAAKLLSGVVIWPEFDDKASEKDTDFNDAHRLYGLEYVKNRIRESGKGAGGVNPPKTGSQAPGTDVISHDWRDGLRLKKNGDIDPKSTVNFMLLMQYAEQLSGVFRYDSFSKRIIVHKCPPWENEADFIIRPLCDYDYFRLEAFMESEFGMKVQKDKCADAITSTAQLPANTFNPASEYFSALQWDGVSRIDDWLKDYVSDGAQPDEYLKLVGRKFLCGLAARAINPGVKFDTMVILEGIQYAGKSYLSRILATINGVEYFLDDFKDIENKDTLMKMQGKLVVEFPEISAMRKAEINDLKAFLTRTHDVFRPPYGRNTIESGRQCVFVGTINPEGPYLRDVTGNRRYWPVSCRSSLCLDDLKKIVPLLHAEAAHFYREGEQLWLTPKEYEIAAREQNKRVVTDVWTDKIIEILGQHTEITTNDILQALDIPHERRTPQTQSRVTQTMVSLGWVPARLAIGSKRPHGFKKGLQKMIDEDIIQEEIPW